MQKVTSPDRRILNDELESRCQRNPRYSLRSFARDLGISAPRLSHVLNGKVGPRSSVCSVWGCWKKERAAVALERQDTTERDLIREFREKFEARMGSKKKGRNRRVYGLGINLFALQEKEVTS